MSESFIYCSFCGFRVPDERVMLISGPSVYICNQCIDMSMDLVHLSVAAQTSNYIHRDAARAWQAFRDFLNGTPKEWARHALDQYLRGVKEGLNGGQA